MTELDYLMAAIHDCGWSIAVHSWRDKAKFGMHYQLRDLHNRYLDIRVDDMLLASTDDPEILVYEAVARLLQHYFIKELKQPEAFTAVRKLAELRRQVDRTPAQLYGQP